MIPKKIHYCWFGKKALPAEVVKCIDSWRKYAPDYEIIQWDESNFDVFSHPFTNAAYKEKAWAFVSDYARLKIIYDDGGIYLDTDVEMLKSMDSLLKNKFFIGKQQGGYPTTGLGYGAEKHSEIVRKMMEEYDKVSFSNDEKTKLACPLLNSKVIYDLGYTTMETIWKKDGVIVFPSKYFDPIAQGNTKNLLCDESYSIHHYAGSWTSKSNILKRKIFRMIGEKNIYKIKKIMGRVE